MNRAVAVAIRATVLVPPPETKALTSSQRLTSFLYKATPSPLGR